MWLVVVGIAAFHLWCGAAQVWGDPELFLAPAQTYVYEHIARHTWGVAQLGIGVALVVGLLMPTFDLARLALAAGVLITLLRLWFQLEAFVDGAGGAIGIPAFALIALFHIATTLEPPVNPASGTSP
jgi:hypothetical protein